MVEVLDKPALGAQIVEVLGDPHRCRRRVKLETSSMDFENVLQENCRKPPAEPPAQAALARGDDIPFSCR